MYTITIITNRTSQVTLVHPHQLVLVTPPVSSVSHTVHTYVVQSVHDSGTPLYTTHTNIMLLVLFYTDINILFEVQRFVSTHVVNWKNLGLALGLLYDTLQTIEREQLGRKKDCMREMLAAWLQRQDNVSQHGIPSWSVLQTALQTH